MLLISTLVLVARGLSDGTKLRNKPERDHASPSRNDALQLSFPFYTTSAQVWISYQVGSASFDDGTNVNAHRCLAGRLEKVGKANSSQSLYSVDSSESRKAHLTFAATMLSPIPPPFLLMVTDAIVGCLGRPADACESAGEGWTSFWDNTPALRQKPRKKLTKPLHCGPDFDRNVNSRIGFYVYFLQLTGVPANDEWKNTLHIPLASCSTLNEHKPAVHKTKRSFWETSTLSKGCFGEHEYFKTEWAESSQQTLWIIRMRIKYCQSTNKVHI